MSERFSSSEPNPVDAGIRHLEDSNWEADHYKPRYLDQGGEQLVLEFEDRPNVVMKVDKRILAKVLRETRLREVSPETLPEEGRVLLEELLDRERAALERLRTYFGNKALLSERAYIQQVPMTKELVETVLPEMDIADVFPDEEIEAFLGVWSLVRLQSRLPPEATSSSAYDLGFHYAERSGRILPEPAYIEATRDLFLSEKEEAAERILYSTWVAWDATDLIRLDDPTFKEVLKSFAEAAIRLTIETGDIFDLAGKGNVILYKEVYNEDGEEKHRWRLILPDARYPDSPPALWEVQKELLTQHVSGEVLPVGDANLLLNILNYARFVNALAIYTGSEMRLPLEFGEDPEEAIRRLWEIAQEALRS